MAAHWARLPGLHCQETLAIAPTQVVLDRLLLLLVAAMVGGIQREFLEGGEMALDSIQPRRIGGRIAANPGESQGKPIMWGRGGVRA